MSIEVTKETFYKIFKNDPEQTEQHETHEKQIYFNAKLDQRGFKIFNHVSSKMYQYYLIDINA